MSPAEPRPESARDERPLLVTSALPYANGPIHFGHVAGAYLPADLFTRFHKLLGSDVLYICGTDEHGVSITVNAEKEGTSYADYVERWHHAIKALFDHFEIEFDHFGRTSTDSEHPALSQEFFLRLLRSGAVAPKPGRQHYCTTCERFLPDRYVEGTCYVCGAAAARGDECKACGSWLEAVKIVEARCVTCGNPPEVRDMMQYELDLGHYFDAEPGARPEYPDARFVGWRRAFGAAGNDAGGAESHGDATLRALAPGGLKRNVQTAIFEKLQHEGDGLRGRPITRDLRWGVPLPATDLDGAEVAGHEGKVLYVWFDAPIGYVSATIEWARAQHPNDPAAALAAWRHYWIVTPDDARAAAEQRGTDTDDGANRAKRLVHFIGKDNIPFHGVVFPSMLGWQSPARDGETYLGPGAGERWVLPENVPSNEFYNLEGRKFSTSDRWTLDNAAMFERFGVDALRWYLTVSMPETADSQFRFEGLADHVNAELNDTLGNYASRVLKFIAKYFDGQVPQPWDGFDPGDDAPLALDDPRRLARAHIDAAAEQCRELLGFHREPHVAPLSDEHRGPATVGDHLTRCGFRAAAGALMDFCRLANTEYDAHEPWKTRKLDDLTQCRADLYGHVQRLSALGVALWPFMPGASDRLRAMLDQPPLGELLAADRAARVSARAQGDDAPPPRRWRYEPLPAGHVLGEPGLLFAKIDKAELEAEKASLLPGFEGAEG